ncbi:RND transporter [Burkholderia stagnalis]|uniref:copper-binding protein n=1 Tax=Burkholderia stagnalis TaxID=1503054 RepID=UPI000754CA5F|nr:copper-binding protein [Burkholderia stagnalis]KVC62156.1 RND transporter [Burkholderia stagnalis]KVD96398.1 RND transporter [Burkholderia stagnalis]KVN16414.1 RND transporter [Burkholderia stagnalis]KVO50449.1 RND transporter [Burkholderia stagnalis]KVP08392.1 RND transporter [Burkholderia stagnalis]
MKKALAAIAAGCALALSTLPAVSHAAGDADATDVRNGMSHGEIRKVDAAAGKLTIKHGPLENLGMDAMTMVFKVKDPAMLSQVKVGDTIDFVAEDVNGALTVTKLQRQ